MASRKKQPESTVQIISESSAPETPVVKKAVAEVRTQTVSGVPAGFKIVPEEYVALPPNVYQDLLDRTQQKTIIHKGGGHGEDEQTQASGPKTYYKVLEKIHLGDCRLTIQEGQTIEYYPRRGFIANGKFYRQLESIKIFIDQQKRGEKVIFEKVDNPSDIETDEWGDFKTVAQQETNQGYEARVKSEESHQPTRPLTKKERIAQIGKNAPPILKAPQANAIDALPPRGSKERKELIRRRGMKNIDQLGTEMERISDIKVQNTSTDTRLISNIPGQSALDTRVRNNVLLGT